MYFKANSLTRSHSLEHGSQMTLLSAVDATLSMPSS